MRDEDRVRIGHMLDAADEVIGFTSARERSDLDSDRMLLFAVVRGIEIIGEAAARMSRETRRPHRRFPGWRWPPRATG